MTDKEFFLERVEYYKAMIKYAEKAIKDLEYVIDLP